MERGTQDDIRVTFDALMTLSNKVIGGIEEDMAQVQIKANTFAANLICSIINSSSRQSQSTRNPDAPELKKNVFDLAFFCHARERSP